MKKFLLTLTLMGGLLGPALRATVPLYENFGNNDYGNTPPEVDALAFANYGFFGVSTLLPYDFQNTVNFTNTGTLSGNPGFWFDSASSSGPRRPADVFVNANDASVFSSDIFFTVPGSGITSASYLFVDATNIVNHGLLSAGAGGLLSLRGSQLDLANGGLQILPVEPSGFPFVTPSNFFPDVAIYDEFWGGVTNQLLDTTALLQGGAVVSPPSQVTNAFGNDFFTQIAAFGLVYYDLNVQNLTPTNIIIQAVFVGLSSTDFVPDIVFAPSSEFGNFYQTAVVRVTLPSTDVVTGNPLFEDLYLVDRLASSTNWTTLWNISTFPNSTWRPSNYELTRSPPFEYFFGLPGNSVLTNNIFADPGYSNVVVTNLYGAYSAFIDKQPVVIPPIDGASITNVPGRIEIRSDSLDLGGTRMRGNSFIYGETKHLITSSNAVVDSPDMSLTLASTNGTLRLQDLIPDVVVRLQGTMNAWSGFWSNQSGILSTNIEPDPTDPTLTVTNISTNVIDIGFHVLIVDASQLTGPVDVLTHRLALKSTNVVIDDNPQVIESFHVDANALVVNGAVQLGGGARDWTAASAPGLLYLTNQGSLNVENNIVLGADRSQPYSAVVNRGTLLAESVNVRSLYFENAGTIIDARNLQINSGDSAFLDGTATVGGDVLLSGNTAKFDQHTLDTSRGIHLTLTNSLTDSGPGAANRWVCRNGFHLTRKPLLGDLYGTRIETTTPSFTRVRHTWAGENRGVSAAGFTNNASLGQLVLNSSPTGKLVFGGTSGNNGLYVESLQLAGPVLTALTNFVIIDPNLVIYFADANVPVESIDGLFNGRLRWVPEYAGPNTSVDVLRLSGQTVQMNRALRFSQTIDTDGDGVANGFDSYPLDPEAWNSLTAAVTPGSSSVSLSWLALPATVYLVESTTNLAAPNWQLVTTYTNTGTAGGMITLPNVNNLTGEAQRFYRVRRNQ